MNQAMRAEQHQSTTGASAIHGHGDHIDPQNRSHIDALNQRHSDGADADRGSGDQNNRDPLARISHNLCDDDGFGGARGVDAGRVPVR